MAHDSQKYAKLQVGDIVMLRVMRIRLLYTV